MIFVFLLFDMLAGIYIGGSLGYLLSLLWSKVPGNSQGKYGKLNMELNVIFGAMVGVTVGFLYWIFFTVQGFGN
jgi:gas vesicle protein